MSKSYILASQIHILAVLFALPTCPVWGQESGASATSLSDVVVTGTKTARPLAEGPVKVDLLSSDEIEKKRYRSLDEAILDIPGATTSGSLGRANSSAILQGLGGDRVLVVIDGVPLAQNASGGFDLSQIGASQIERVEVIKGGASSLYGGQAMGGVIQVITKKPKQGAHYSVELQDEILWQGSSDQDGPTFISAQANGKDAKQSYKVSAQRKAQPSVDLDTSSVTRDTPDIKKWNAQAGFEQKVGSSTKLGIDYSYFAEQNRSYSAELKSTGNFDLVHNDTDSETHRVKAAATLNLNEKLSSQTYLFTEITKDRLALEDDPNTPYQESLKTSNLNHQRIESQLDYIVGNHVVTFGAVGDLAQLDTDQQSTSANQTTLKTKEVDGRSSQLIEGYVQDDWTFGKSELVSGARVSGDPAFGTHFAPKLSYSLRLPKINDADSIIRTSYGTGYRLPSLKERYYLLDHRSFAGYTVEGNEDLRPETSQSFQAGLELNKRRDWHANLNLFLNEVRDMVTTKELATNGSERKFQFVNLDRVRIYGLEAAAGYHLIGPMNLTHAFTYTHAEDLNSGLILMARPFYTGSTTLSFDFEKQKTEVFLIGRYFGDAYADSENTEKDPGYIQVDLRVNYKIQSNISVFGGVLNVFNKHRDPYKDQTATSVPQSAQQPAIGSYALIGLRGEIE